jgi:hypothetical protein
VAFLQKDVRDANEAWANSSKSCAQNTFRTIADDCRSVVCARRRPGAFPSNALASWRGPADHARDGESMLYMVIEHYRGDPVPVYRRFRDHGRLAPEGLRYVSSWVSQDLLHCFQVMECDDPELLQAWIDRWQDLVDFEVTSVVTSVEAAAAVAPRL